MHIHQTTREERAHHVVQMRANFSLEDIHPQADDLELEQRYIDDKISLEDMLLHARDFARRAANSDDPSKG